MTLLEVLNRFFYHALYREDTAERVKTQTAPEGKQLTDDKQEVISTSLDFGRNQATESNAESNTVSCQRSARKTLRARGMKIL